MNESRRGQLLKALALAPVAWGLSRHDPAQSAKNPGVNPYELSHNYFPAAWEQMPGQMFSVALGMEGSVFGLGMDASNPMGRPIFKWNANRRTWDTVPGLAQRIAIANNGDIWAVNGQQQIFRMAGHGAPWLQQFGAAVDISARSEVWVVGTNQQVFRFNGKAWDGTLASGTMRVTAGATPGEAYALTTNGKLFVRQGADLTTVWKSLLSVYPLRDFSMDGKGFLWCIDSLSTPGKILPQRDWDPFFTDGKGVCISAGASEVWLTTAQGSIFKTRV